SSLTQDFNFDDDYEQKSTNLDENSPSTSSKTASLFDVLEDNFSDQKRKLTTEKKEISSSKPTNLNLVSKKKQMKMTISKIRFTKLAAEMITLQKTNVYIPYVYLVPILPSRMQVQRSSRVT
uniref:Uncharacterized protein n=1 Tax=Romanomermis culicivorax TaxID=13658 RepID=A0A915HEH2_ROMCU